MPCSQHRSKNSKCSSCLAAELLTRIGELSGDGGSKSSSLGHQLKALQKQYGDMKLKDSKADDAELCRTLFASLNAKLIGLKLEPVFLGDDDDLINAVDIQPAHRASYRARIAQMGTWLGFSEFTTLARLFEVRFSIMVQAGAVWNAVPIGSGGHALLANHALYFTGNHYEVCDTAPVEGGYRCSNIIATNEYGDCGLESFLILLVRNNHHQTWYVVSQAERARLTALRWFAELWRERTGPVLDRNNAEYIACLREIRRLLSTDMTALEVDHAIIAEGHLPPESSECGKKKGSSGEVTLALPSWSLSGAAPAFPWGGTFGIRSKRIGQAGYHNQAFAPIGAGRAFSFGSNFNASDGLWTRTIDFVFAREDITTAEVKDNLASQGVDRKDIAFIPDEALGLNSKPMHLSSVLVIITVGKQQHFFTCAGVNMHAGNGSGARAEMCIFGRSGDNGLHSEKYCMDLICLLLQGFGINVPRMLGDSLGDRTGAVPADGKVARVDVIFLNIAPMCDTCEGHWGRFRAALMKAGIPEVHGFVWWYAHDIKTWK